MLKLLLGWALVFLIRLIPFRMPNLDPILGTLMPFSARLNYVSSFAFAFLSIFLYDLVTSGIGTWTWITAITYGVVGLAARYYFQGEPNKQPKRIEYVSFAVMGILVYDIVTMAIGPLTYGQPWISAITGQIPFTAMHLAGGISFAFLVSPLLYRWIVDNSRLEFPSVIPTLTKG